MVKLQARRFGVSLANLNIVCKKSVALKIDVVGSIGLHLLETLIFVGKVDAWKDFTGKKKTSTDYRSQS